MSGKTLTFFIFLSIFLVASSTASATSSIEISRWGVAESTSNPIIVDDMPLYIENANCNLETQTYYSGNGTSPFSLNWIYYSPQDKIQLTGYSSGHNNVSCFNLGKKSQITDTLTNGFFETKTKITHGAYQSKAYIYEKLYCELQDDYITISSSPSGKQGTNQYNPNVLFVDYGKSWSWKNNLIGDELEQTNFEAVTNLGDAYKKMKEYEYSNTCPFEIENKYFSKSHHFSYTDFVVDIGYMNWVPIHYYVEEIPITTTDGMFQIEVGNANITITEINNPYPTYQIWIGYYPLDNKNELVYLSKTSGDRNYFQNFNFSSNVTIIPNKEYIVFVSYIVYQTAREGNQKLEIEFNHTNWSVTYSSYVPNWNCSEWSECDKNGIQTRICNDLNGIVTDKIETQSCFTLTHDYIYLGFEDSYPQNIWTCQQDWSCTVFANIENNEYPSGWKVSNSEFHYNATGQTGLIHDFLKMTNEYHSDQDPEGTTKSLKMWYNPPMTNYPVPTVADNTTSIYCENTTTGAIPEISKEVNESIFLQKELTFPAPYMRLTYQVRKCKSPEIQYSSPNLYGLSACTLLTGEPIDKCYTNSKLCNVTPDARLYFSLYDENDAEIVFNHIEDEITKTDEWQTKTYTLSNVLDENHEYLFNIGIVPPDSNLDTGSYCLYLDNIKFLVDSSEIECRDYCDTDGTGTLYKAKQLSGLCEWEAIPLSPLCTSQEIIETVSNNESTCDCDSDSPTYMTYFYYNEETGEVTAYPNSDLCVTECSDIVEQELNEQQSTTPISYLGSEGLNITGMMEDYGIGFASMFLTPIFIVFLLSVLIGGFIAAKTGSFEIGIITIMGIIILASLPAFGIFPSWFILVFIILGGLVFARFVYKVYTGG